MMRFTTKVLPSRSGNMGILKLNNAKALHALTLEMLHSMTDVLEQWHKDESMKAILIQSSTEEMKRPAFCAGGDVKSLYRQALEQPELLGTGVVGSAAGDFFRDEYKLNHTIACSPKPQIALWDGFVMGGGVGISAHGKYRVATENTILSMPETAIGLIPDVGGMYWLHRALSEKHDGLATYLSLTGHRLKPEDLLYTGLATHFVPSKRLAELETALVQATTKDDMVAPVLMSFHERPPVDPSESFAAQNRQSIQKVFGNETNYSMEDVFLELNQMEDTDFGKNTLKTLQKMSPTSLKVTLEGFRRGSKLSNIGEHLQMEFRMVQRCLRKDGDFYEGIRAALVDKDHNPQWNPKELGQVTDAMVSTFFEPLPHEWEIPPIVESSKL